MVYFLSIIEQFNDGEQDDLAQYTIFKSFLDPIGSLVSTLLVGRWLVVGHTFSNCKIVRV